MTWRSLWRLMTTDGRGVTQAAKDNYEAARAVLEETWPEVLEK